MPKYISLMSDFGFKRVFANPDYPHILISFIESVLPELSIESIEHIDTTQFADYVDDRTSIFDVFCKMNDGSFVIVEMQQVRQEHYVDRTVLYGSYVIQRQSQKGKWNYELPKHQKLQTPTLTKPQTNIQVTKPTNPQTTNQHASHPKKYQRFSPFQSGEWI